MQEINQSKKKPIFLCFMIVDVQKKKPFSFLVLYE